MTWIKEAWEKGVQNRNNPKFRSSHIEEELRERELVCSKIREVLIERLGEVFADLTRHGVTISFTNGCAQYPQLAGLNNYKGPEFSSELVPCVVIDMKGVLFGQARVDWGPIYCFMNYRNSNKPVINLFMQTRKSSTETDFSFLGGTINPNFEWRIKNYIQNWVSQASERVRKRE